MLKFVSRLFLLIGLMPFIVNAAPVVTFVEGKDYEVLTTTLEGPQPKSQVHVIEFFSYGCPACNHFEPALEAWLVKKPSYVAFERVPVVFEENWDLLARTYYTARTLGIADKMTPLLFKAIHQDGKKFDNETVIADFFAQQGVDKKAFDDTFNFSPGLDAQMLRGNNLMRTYRVMEVPTLVIEGKYKVSPRMTNGDSERMLRIADYLIQKEKTGGH